MIKSPDIYVLSGMLVNEGDWTYRSLADRLRVPHPVVQRALGRTRDADLYSVERRNVHLLHFQEFAIHALRFVSPVQLGPLVPGLPAAWAADPVAGRIYPSEEDLPPVWPFARGQARGQMLEPLHSAAPEAVQSWPQLGQVLAILDSLRAGDLRVRRVAEELLVKLIFKRAGDN